MNVLSSKRSYSARFQNADNESFDYSVYPQSKRQKQLPGNPDVPPPTPHNAVFDRALWDQQFCNFGWDGLGALFSEKSLGPSNGITEGPSTAIAPASTSLDQTLSLPAESYTSLCTDHSGYPKSTDGIDKILRSSRNSGLSTQGMTNFPVQKQIEQITNDLNLQGVEQATRIPRQQDQPWDPLFPNSQPIQCFQSNNRMSSTRPNSVNAGLTNGLTARGQLGRARSEVGPLDSTYASWDFQNHTPEIRPTRTIPFNSDVQPTSNDCFGPGLFTDSSMLVNDGTGKRPPSTNYVSREDWDSDSNGDTASNMPSLAVELSLVDGQPQGPPWFCSTCHLKFKNQSESKKHLLRHLKPYKCKHPGCHRPDGFSTRNDLDRHRKSLHKIATPNKTDKTYRCAAPNCTKHTKIWPRLDNFRQHCARTHKDLPTDDLVKQSEYPKPGLQCVSRTQRNNKDTPAPAPFHTPRDRSLFISTVNTKNLSSSQRSSAGHGNDTDNLCDGKSSVSAAPSAPYTRSRCIAHASHSIPPDPPDLSNPLVPHDPNMLRSSGLDNGSSRVLHRSMLSEGDLVSDRAGLGQYTMPLSQPSSYTTACRSTHPLLVDPRLQGGHQSIDNPSLPNWYSYHRSQDTSLEELETRYPKIFQGRSEISRYEPPLAPAASARQSPTIEQLQDPLFSMELSRTAGQEAKKITHEVFADGLLNLPVSQVVQLKLQDSLQRSLASLEDRYQDNLQRALASLNLREEGGEVHGRENDNGKIAVDEERHKCLDCNKVSKTHSDLKKHVLRHSRPYTCTDENCQLSFGSKNDWKRHERTIHDDPSLNQAFWCALRFDSIKDMNNHDKVMTSLETEAIIDRSFDGMRQDPVAWDDRRCLEPDVPNTERCQFVVWRKEYFYEHLYTKHGVIKPVLSSTQLSSSSSSPPPPDPFQPIPAHFTAAKKARKDIKMQCHVGRNGTNGFWCGFCNSVITIDRALRGAPAWDARYKHIDEHHFRQVGMKYFEEATRAEGVEGGSEQRTTSRASQANEGKQGEEQQPWLPRRKGDLWVVLGTGKTKGRLRYDEERQEKDKLENGSNSDESEEGDIAPQSATSEIAAQQHGGEDESAAATNTTTILDQDHPSNITHLSTERRARFSPNPAQPDPPPPERRPTPTIPFPSNHHDSELENDNPRAPSHQPPNNNESILDEDYIANLGTIHPPLYPPPLTPIQQPQPQHLNRHRHTRSTASAAAKQRWWRCHICNDGPWDSKWSDQCGSGGCFHYRCKDCLGQARN